MRVRIYHLHMSEFRCVTCSHLKQAEATRAEFVLSLSVFQRQILNKLVYKDGVGEVIIDDLLPLKQSKHTLICHLQDFLIPPTRFHYPLSTVHMPPSTFIAVFLTKYYILVLYVTTAFSKEPFSKECGCCLHS